RLVLALGAVVVLVLFFVVNEVLADSDAGDGVFEGPVLLAHDENLGVRVLVLEDLDQVAYFHLPSPSRRGWSADREDIQALLCEQLKAIRGGIRRLFGRRKLARTRANVAARCGAGPACWR